MAQKTGGTRQSSHKTETTSDGTGARGKAQNHIEKKEKIKANLTLAK